MLLEHKIAVIYGAAGAIGSAVARARNLSAELAPQGIRLVGLRSQGMPETGTIKEVFGLHAKASGISWGQFQALIAGRTHTGRLSTLEETAEAAVFAASDRASAMTGTVMSLSMGSLDD